MIAAELVFGASLGAAAAWAGSSSRASQLEIPSVFAGLLTVIILGLVVENCVFLVAEKITVRRWGMQQ